MQQSEINLFSYVLPKYKITKPIRLIELFAGIGSQAKALKKIGVKFEHWKVVEIDEHALNSYNAIHQTNFTPQDITRIHSEHLEMRERELYIYSNIFISVPRFIISWKIKRNGKRKSNKKWLTLGS